MNVHPHFTFQTGFVTDVLGKWQSNGLEATDLHSMLCIGNDVTIGNDTTTIYCRLIAWYTGTEVSVSLRNQLSDSKFPEFCPDVSQCNCVKRELQLLRTILISAFSTPTRELLKWGCSPPRNVWQLVVYRSGMVTCSAPKGA
jgi:hypothetical protein